MCVCVCVCVYVCDVYIDTYIHTYIHPSIRPYIHIANLRVMRQGRMFCSCNDVGVHTLCICAQKRCAYVCLPAYVFHRICVEVWNEDVCLQGQDWTWLMCTSCVCQRLICGKRLVKIRRRLLKMRYGTDFLRWGTLRVLNTLYEWLRVAQAQIYMQVYERSIYIYTTLQHMVSRCIVLQHTATHVSTYIVLLSHCMSDNQWCAGTDLSLYIRHCNAWYHTTSHCNILQHTRRHTLHFSHSVWVTTRTSGAQVQILTGRRPRDCRCRICCAGPMTFSPCSYVC